MGKHKHICFLISLLILFSLLSVIPVASVVGTDALGNTSSSAGSGTTSNSRTIYIDDNLTINGPASYKDETVYLNGNLTIESNGVLKLDNSILIINRSALTHFVFKIFVHSGGRLEVTNNSVIKNNIFQSNKYEFEFAVDSEGYFKDCTIINAGEFSENGFVVRSDKITFTNCSFDDNYIGLHVIDASPSVIDCDIIDSDKIGIKLNNSDVKLQDCTFDYSGDRDVDLEHGSTLTLVSTPLDYGAPIVLDTSELHVAWYLTVNVSNGSAPLANASVQVFNYHDNLTFSGKTDQTGMIENIECTEYIQNSTGSNYTTPHTVKVALDDYEPLTDDLDMYADTVLDTTLILKPKTGIINGHILDTEGSAVPNANVSVEVDGETFWALTDETGLYELGDVLAGENYTVTVEALIDNLSAYEIKTQPGVNVNASETITVNITLVKKHLPVSVTIKSRDAWINAENAVDVNIDTIIKIEFDSPVDNMSFENNISLMQGVTLVPGLLESVGSGGTSKAFEFTPINKFHKEETCKITISKGVKSSTGEPLFWDSYIATFDTEIEPIIDTSPEDNSTNVDNEAPGIFVVFHNKVKLNLTSLTANFGLKLLEQVIDGTVTIADPLTNRVVFTPSEPLQGSTEYTVEIADTLKDGNNQIILRRHVEWSFTTKFVSPPTAEVSGVLKDKTTGELIVNAKVELLDENRTIVDETITNVEGAFTFADVEAGEYAVVIKVTGYNSIEVSVNAGAGDTVALGDLSLSQKEDDDDDGDGGFDMMLLVGIGIVIVIVIIIILILFLRKRTGAEEEGVTFEEAPQSMAERAKYGGDMATAATMPISMPPPVSTSMNRCPNCAHKLTSAGECFHCNIAAKYGL